MKLKTFILLLFLSLVGVVGVKAQSSTLLSELVGKAVTVSSDAAANLTTGQWYVMFNRGDNGTYYHGYLFEKVSEHKLYNTSGVPNGPTSSTGKYLVRLSEATNGKYYLQTGYGNYFGKIEQSTAVPVTSDPTEEITVGKIANTDGHFYLQAVNGGVVLDANSVNYGEATVVGWGTTVPSSTEGNNDWAFYPVQLEDAWIPTASEVYTINNTNSYRGALIYNPDASTKWVWSSGKSGTFNSTSVNSQWVFVPTGTADQYYLYNVGAQKFVIPVNDGTYNGYSWAFSNDAVAVTLTKQSDGTYKFFTATGSICLSVSNNYTGPIINYNDVGAQFTITKVDNADQSAAATAAADKLVKNACTALTSYPQTSGWYVIQIKTASSNTASVGRYVYTNSELYNDLYPLTFTGSVDVQPSVSDPTFFTRLDCRDWNDNDWQLPDGRYLVGNANNKFPVSSATASAIIAGYDGGNYFKSSSNYFADPYTSNGNYFVGETSSFRTTWNVYPINLVTAGLTAWQVICDAAAETTKISCTRSDVSGLTSVYKNGYFFLPTNVTPTDTDFNMPGATSYTIDTTNHTVTIAYDPSLAIVAEGVSVYQGYGTTGLGNEKAVLLRMQVAPFNQMENAVMTFTLTNPNNISAVKVYETSNNVEFNAISTYTNTFDGNINGTTATIQLGSVTSGTHYYWLCATIANDAVVGDVIDAALTSITYDYNGYTGTTCDLTDVGNPANSMKIFDKQQYLFLPTTNGSNYYRIPALIMANDGSLIAACDKRYNSSSDLGSHKIDVVMRRSTDGGATWTEVATIATGDGNSDAAYGYGDPAFVKTTTGKIICLMAAGKNSFWQGMSNIAMITSSDNGATWTSPVDITITQGMLTNKSSKSDWFVTSGKGLCTSDGVIMFLLDADHNAETNLVLYSTDEGSTWVIDDQVVATGANEAKLVELESGKLLSSTRNPGNRIFNTGTYTLSEGTCTFTWGTQTTNGTLNQGGSGNNQDIIVYSRNNDGSAKALIHTLTTGYGHNTLKLFMSIDQGTSWKEVMLVQSSGSRYAVTTILENGDLGLLFEDYSLETGREYPINFLTVKKEQIDEWYNLLLEAAEDAANTVMIADGTNTHGPASYGDASTGTINNNPTLKNNWTSNETAGIAGLKLNADNNLFMEETAYSSFHCLGIKPSAGNATDVITITAPNGYLVKGFYMEAGYWTSSENYTLTTNDGTGVKEHTTSAAPSNGRTALNVTGIYKRSTTFSVQSLQSSNNRCLMVNKFYVILTKDYPVSLNVVGEKSYATLYLPFDVQTDADTKAYYASDAANGTITLVDLNGEIAAKTAVVLINDKATTNPTFSVTSGLTPAVSEGNNLLKGTLTSLELDLSQSTPYYSMGRKDGKIGFYKFDNGNTTTITLSANKAYLDTNASTNSSRGFTFDFGNSSDIEMLNSSTSQPFNSSTIYNLQGRKTLTLNKGVNIVRKSDGSALKVIMK